MKLLTLALIGLFLTACQSAPSPARVSVLYKPHDVELPLCTTTGSLMFFERGQVIPPFYLESADQVMLTFEFSRCDYTQRHTVKRSGEDTMPLEEFNTRMQFEEGFKAKVAAWEVL